jgi:hypothetical protein
MVPRQLDEVARQHTSMMQARAPHPVRQARPRREPKLLVRDPTASSPRGRSGGRIRQRAGWTLVALGLRIAADGR